MKKLPCLVLLLALCAVLRGQEQPSSKTDPAALDSAKRDLKDLPAVVRSRDLTGKPVGPAALPSLAISTETAPLPTQAETDSRTPSEHWLQDALAKTDAEKAAQTPAQGLQNPTSGYKTEPDPLAQFMTQWLSPGDRKLLYPEPSREAAGTLPTEVSSRSPGPGLDAAAPIWAPLTAAKNPYLEESEPSEAPAPLSPLPSTTPSGEDPTKVAPLTSLQAAPAQPSGAPKAKSPTEPTPPRPPTAPIVDDRKYFPQLRRF